MASSPLSYRDFRETGFRTLKYWSRGHGHRTKWNIIRHEVKIKSITSSQIKYGAFFSWHLSVFCSTSHVNLNVVLSYFLNIWINSWRRVLYWLPTKETQRKKILFVYSDEKRAELNVKSSYDSVSVKAFSKQTCWKYNFALITTKGRL